MVSRIRQNFHEECEASINKQINMELTASYCYLALSSHFDRSDISLPHATEFFRKASHEEREHAEKFIDYQNQRGGRVRYNPLPEPDISQVKTLLDAMKLALKWERDVNDMLLKLHELADKHNDYQLADFIEANYLTEQVEASKQLGDYITQLEKCGDGLGEFMFDKLTLKEEAS